MANTLFEGYIWKSDRTKPELFLKEKAQLGLMAEDGSFSINGEKHTNGENPFIVEGQFYRLSDNLSVSIKYVDGEYIVTKFTDVKVENGEEFIPNRMEGDGICKLRFQRIWEALPDEHCCNFPVMQPVGFAFVGFKTKEEKK